MLCYLLESALAEGVPNDSSEIPSLQRRRLANVEGVPGPGPSQGDSDYSLTRCALWDLDIGR